jgi:anti-sigma factor RsiW
MSDQMQGTMPGGLSCRDVLALASDFHDGDLAPAETDSFSRHLEICPRCDRFYQSFERTIRVARGAVLLRPSPEVRERLVDGVMKRLSSAG